MQCSTVHSQQSYQVLHGDNLQIKFKVKCKLSVTRVVLTAHTNCFHFPLAQLNCYKPPHINIKEALPSQR